MLEIQRITTGHQTSLIEDKLSKRAELTALTDISNPNYELNRQVALDLAKEDWVYFCDNFLWIQDPEALDYDEKEIPFLLWDFQEKGGQEIIKAIVEGYDLPVEKARKMGITWVTLSILLWGWHFHKWEVLVGSRKAEEVDKRGDIGSLFEKIRFMVKRLPTWVFEKPFDHYTDKVMMLIHPSHGASMVGEGNNPDFGRSDRRKVVFLDEFTSWEQTDRAAWQGLSATTKSRIAVSTPNTRGVNCYFYEIVKDHKKKDKPILTLDWKLHPVFAEGLRATTEQDMAFIHFNLEETSPWLENEIRRSTSIESVAQEILINYEVATSGKVFATFSMDQVSDDVDYNENLPLYVTWDFGLDSTAILWIQPDRAKGKINIIDEYQNNDLDIYHYLDIVESKGYKRAMHYGDPNSGQARHITSMQSPISILRRAGITFNCQKTSIVNRVAAGRNMLAQVMVSSKCILAIEMFTSWQLRRPKSGTTRGTIPDHSDHSHIGEAYTYFAWNYSQSNNKISKVKTKKYAPSVSGVMA